MRAHDISMVYSGSQRYLPDGKRKQTRSLCRTSPPGHDRRDDLVPQRHSFAAVGLLLPRDRAGSLRFLFFRFSGKIRKNTEVDRLEGKNYYGKDDQRI